MPARPALRAAAGPPLNSCRSTFAPCRAATAATPDSSAEPSSTTTTGYRAASDVRQRSSIAARSRTGITTVTSSCRPGRALWRNRMRDASVGEPPGKDGRRARPDRASAQLGQCVHACRGKPQHPGGRPAEQRSVAELLRGRVQRHAEAGRQRRAARCRPGASRHAASLTEPGLTGRGRRRPELPRRSCRCWPGWPGTPARRRSHPVPAADELVAC